MAWTNPTSRTTGELITASIWNTDIRDNLIELRQGGVAITSQADTDFITANSSTQLTRMSRAALKILSESYF